MSSQDKNQKAGQDSSKESWTESGPYRLNPPGGKESRKKPRERVKLAPKPLKMDPRADAPMEIFDEMAPHQLSEAARSVRLDAKLDKNVPQWLRQTMGNVVYYLSVPARQPLIMRIWNHRLRVPIQYAAIGVALALVANLFDFFRIYSLRGEGDSIPAPPRVMEPMKEEPNTLAAMREAFNQSVYRVETEKAIKERGWPNEYITKLEELKDKYREKGLFMEWMAVKREQDRFLSEQQIFEKHLVKQPPDLRHLQIGYFGIVDRYESDMNGKLLALYDKYIKQLGELHATADKAAAHTIDVEVDFIKKMIETTPQPKVVEAIPEAVNEPAPAATNAPAAAEGAAPEGEAGK